MTSVIPVSDVSWKYELSASSMYLALNFGKYGPNCSCKCWEYTLAKYGQAIAFDALITSKHEQGTAWFATMHCNPTAIASTDL